jgi:hypothetical protein
MANRKCDAFRRESLCRSGASEKVSRVNPMNTGVDHQLSDVPDYLAHVLTHERRLKCSKRIDHAASLIVPETCLLGTIIVDVTVDGLSFSSASCRSYLEPWEH